MKLNSPPAVSQGREAKHLKPKVGAGAPWMGGWFDENHFPTFVGMEILITSIARRPGISLRHAGALRHY